MHCHKHDAKCGCKYWYSLVLNGLSLNSVKLVLQSIYPPDFVLDLL